MKRRYILKRLAVFSAREGTVCNRCHWHRAGEPYVKRIYSYRTGENRTEIVCWRCCHDEETTRLIMDNYPSAFVRHNDGQWWYLEWAPQYALMWGDIDGN